jgi:hypothetical protein
MVNLTIDSEGLDRILERLARLDPGQWDLRGLGERLGRILETDNMAARMLGVDYEGQEFAPLAPATLERRMGAGPPLAPMEMASRIISGVQVDVNDTGHNAVEVVLSWPSMPFLRYHVTGTTRMPARDPCGIRPEAWAEIEREVSEWVDNLTSAWG